jgi:hypothetical protein
MREDLGRYLDVFQALDTQGVRYVAVGGVAVVLRGHVRPVADLDLVVDPEPAASAHAVRTLLALAFVPSIPLPLHLVTVLRMFDASRREIDLFSRYHVPFAALWTHSDLLPVAGCPVRIASLDHTLQVKRLLGRPDDLLDVEGLMKVWP